MADDCQLGKDLEGSGLHPIDMNFRQFIRNAWNEPSASIYRRILVSSTPPEKSPPWAFDVL
jgi:hypothetical protein